MSINKIVWLTDIHLNFLEKDARMKFYQSVTRAGANAILITGDIAEATDVCHILGEFSAESNMPIYFVLGNHDYYFGSITSVRKKILALCDKNRNLIWLGKPEIIALNSDTVLVGHDGWADARYGDFDHSPINLNDSRLIRELFHAFLLNRSVLKDKMQQLADRDAKILKRSLSVAIKSNPKKIIIATHVPPFAESCWHKGQMSDKNWLPYFASKSSGDVIFAAAKKYSNLEFLVLCGHTHSKSEYQPIQNLVVDAGSAEYGQPEIQKIISV